MDKLVCNKYKRQTVTYIMKLWGLVLASAMNIYTCLDSHSKQKSTVCTSRLFMQRPFLSNFNFQPENGRILPYEIRIFIS